LQNINKGQNVMDTTIVVSVAGLGIPVNRLVELIKQTPAFQNLSEELRWWLALALSVVFGELMAFILVYNAFPDVGANVVVQTALTGLAIAAVSNGWNSLSDFVAALIARLTPQELRSETSLGKAQAVSRTAKAQRVATVIRNGG
jgi:hypothetical protein